MTLKGDGVTFDGKYLANGATSAGDFSDMGESTFSSASPIIFD